MNIQKATAIYTGGGIYLYYAELENDNWIMGNDEWLLIVGKNPLQDEESDYYEWQMENLVEEIPQEKYQEMLNSIIDTILNGKSIKEHDNFSKADLENRKA